MRVKGVDQEMILYGNNYPRNSQNMQGSPNMQGSANMQGSQNIQGLPNMQGASNMQGTSNMQGSQNMQNMQNPQNLQEECRKYASYHVILKMLDGSTVDGIIESVDNDRIIILVGEDVMEQENANQGENQRQPFGYGPRRRFRRFRKIKNNKYTNGDDRCITNTWKYVKYI